MPPASIDSLPPMAKPILLVVDDDSDVLNAIARDLRTRYGRDYRVLRAESGTAALGLLRELKERDTPVALLLSDQRMPGMDGVTFLSQTMEDFPKAKRAVITVNSGLDLFTKVLSGATGEGQGGALGSGRDASRVLNRLGSWRVG